MHPVREYVYTPAKNLCIHTQSGETETFEYVRESPRSLYYLSYGVKFDKEQDPKFRYRESHVLPKQGIKVTRFTHWRERSAEDFDYYVDIVRVTEKGECWVVRDLYLDVLVFEGVQAKILDTDEYLAAIREGHLDVEEAAYALTTAYTLLNGLAKYGYSLEAYLQTEGVTPAWPRLKSTP